jgi:predicted RNA binding protein YcfA (HicA-like mRNA interferase family)
MLSVLYIYQEKRRTYNVCIKRREDMPKKTRQLEREILKAGFKFEKGKGKGGHRRYKHPDGRTVEIPFHTNEIKKGTELAILKQAGLR